MLSELKEELEYCRRKWALAREKNNESQSQWNDLRSEFSRRKLEDANNSAESGYSDEPVSDDDNSDEESTEVNNIQGIRSKLDPASKKLIRVQTNKTPGRQDSITPPISTYLTEVFQTTSEIVSADLTQASVVSKPVENLDLNYAARSSTVQPKTASKITVKNVACEGPSTSSSGVKPKYVDEVRPRLSRELRKKSTKAIEKRKDEETLEEMFFRLSGQEPPQPEASSSYEHLDSDDDLENNDELEDNEELEIDDNNLLEYNDLENTPHLVEEEPPNPEDISHIILSEEDEARRAQRAARFQRLEEQCQQLITQVINNSTRGDELNLHLDNVQRRFTPIRENSKSIDKSDEEGATGCSSEMVSKDSTDGLTQREQEYTSRRAERLRRLEEECKEFLNKQNKSKIRANEMSNKLDKLHQRYGGSQENPEACTSENCEKKETVLTEEEEMHMNRRAERLKRLEEQSAELLERMAQSSSRAKNIESSLDELHSKFGDKESTENGTDVQSTDEYIEDETIDVTTANSLDDAASVAHVNLDDSRSHTSTSDVSNIGTENVDDENSETVPVTATNNGVN